VVFLFIAVDMIGPSIVWSAFTNSVDEAIAQLRDGRVTVVVTERMDESLVVVRHALGWSLADVVVTK
jgi:Galactose-3-O-sulfotransferase